MRSYGDSFSYQTWAGHYDLVKFNLRNPAVRQHLFDAVSMWYREFAIDGLRLDAADHIDPDFLRALAVHCRQLNPDFWLMGEVVHGDYKCWANPDMLATTNYEAYKGLYSSHVDANYHEIAYSLNRQFGDGGLYRDRLLYAFADNHDVNRVASSLKRRAHLYPLYLLLFTMPGVPSIYYGSEWGMTGERNRDGDYDLRPCIDLNSVQSLPDYALAESIACFAALRRDLPALRYGRYRQLHVAPEQFAFARATPEQTVIVAVNGADRPASIRLSHLSGNRLTDRLNGVSSDIRNGQAAITLHPHWGAVFVVDG